MRYQLEKYYYHDGTIFEVNKLPPRSYFIPYPNKESADRVSPAEKRYASPLVECLNGAWDFHFYPRPAELPDEFDTEQVVWEKIAVPGCWQFQGYDRPFYLNCRYQFPFDPPNIPREDPVDKVFSIMRTGNRGPGYEHPKEEYNFVGVYRRFLSVEGDGQGYVISFLGVASCLELYVNGRFVGYSEGSHNTAEFDLSDYLHRGENELLAVVRRWCTGSYLECQDMFRNNGIFRDVLLRKPCTIWDINTKTKKTETGYDLTVQVHCFGEQAVQISLFDHSVAAQGEEIEISFRDLKVEEWTADKPMLYDLYISTGNECIKCCIGFRDIRIEGRKFLVNGKAIKFHGVNHHDTSSTGGYTMTPAEIERDIKICKEFNIDTIRTAHYPPDPYLLELCDRYGIYVVDEADLETHGAFMHRFPPSYNLISKNPYWEKHYLDRALRLYERDKLHPCLVMWSLGNEAGGYRNTDAMYALLKERTDLPIHYESVIHSRRKAYDVGSQMYPTVEQVRAVGQGISRTPQLNDRPYFLCEYAHAMGVGPGAMEDYWAVIYAHDSLMGGCIWEMVDHAVLHPDGSYTYGGDHGEWCHDSNFCVDGIFYPDRTPSTGARIAKFVYRPIRVKHLEDNRFELFNTTGFRPGTDYTLRFVWSDGRTAELSPEVSPLDKTVITVEPTGTTEPAETRVSWVTITTVERDTGREAAVEQILLSDMERLELEPANFPADFSVEEGKPSIDGLAAGASPRILLTRISTDNDKSLIGQKPLEEFYGVREEHLETLRQEDRIVTKIRLHYQKSRFLCTDTYEAVSGGVLVTSELRCEKGRGDLPRFGVCFRLDECFDRVTYLGRNGESYCDMKDQCQVAPVTCMVKDMTEPNIRPQESGNRMDCQYVTLSDGERSIQFTAVDRPFELAVKPYSDEELSQMTHRCDEVVTGTYVTVQAFQMGIGTGSCGPATQKQYRFDRRGTYKFSYLISWNK